MLLILYTKIHVLFLQFFVSGQINLQKFWSSIDYIIIEVVSYDILVLKKCLFKIWLLIFLESVYEFILSDFFMSFCGILLREYLKVNT